MSDGITRALDIGVDPYAMEFDDITWKVRTEFLLTSGHKLAQMARASIESAPWLDFEQQWHIGWEVGHI